MRHVYVIINRDTGFIYGVTDDPVKASIIRDDAELTHLGSTVSVSCEPVL
jgi:hypothetical protein